MLKLNIHEKRPIIDQTWSVIKIARQAPPKGWEQVFRDADPELSHISAVLEKDEATYGYSYPLKKDYFAAFDVCPLVDNFGNPFIKAVIVGQDPYPQAVTINGISMPRAMGLSFSVRQGDSIPSSLQNIYKELERSVNGFNRPNHGDLTMWAKQGILMLNMSLTVRPGAPNSHAQFEFWLGFHKKVFKAIDAVNPNCIYVLWGQKAQKIKTEIGEKSIVFEAPHPSGMSANKGFFGCNHFNLINETLIKLHKPGINWSGDNVTHITPDLSFNNQMLIPVSTNTLSTLPIVAPVKITHPLIIPSYHQGEIQLNNLGSLPMIPNVTTFQKSEPDATESKTKLITISQPINLTRSVVTDLMEKPPAPNIPKIHFGHINPNINVINIKTVETNNISSEQKHQPNSLPLPVINPLI
jgi:uracil-DNA glycosylase